MIEFLNKTKSKIDFKIFSKIGETILRDHQKSGLVFVSFIDKKEMQKQNKRYRAKDKATDVISVNLENNNFIKANDWLGEILICKQVVDSNAKDYNEDKKKEIVRVFIHGVLHVLGYDHELGEQQEKVMREKEEYYLSKSF